MLTHDLLSDLRCSCCPNESLEPHVTEMNSADIIAGELRCGACGTSYEIRGGVPDLIPNQILTDEWEMWKTHLNGFDARRKWRDRHPNRFASRVTHDSGSMHESFAAFAEIEEGCVLDIGCGPGNFRRRFDSRAVQYWGVDPLPLAQAQHFPFARAVAEHLPFRNGMFTDIVVTAAMDHFQNVSRFCEEAVRVMSPGGRLHIIQSVNDIRSPITAIKSAAHWIKDRMEAGETSAAVEDTPKHMTEFNRSSLHRALDVRFTIKRNSTFSKRWYSPENVFLTLAARS